MSAPSQVRVKARFLVTEASIRHAETPDDGYEHLTVLGLEATWVESREHSEGRDVLSSSVISQVQKPWARIP